jgi:hypothetical protein
MVTALTKDQPKPLWVWLLWQWHPPGPSFFLVTDRGREAMCSSCYGGFAAGCQQLADLDPQGDLLSPTEPPNRRLGPVEGEGRGWGTDRTEEERRGKGGAEDAACCEAEPKMQHAVRRRVSLPGLSDDCSAALNSEIHLALARSGERPGHPALSPQSV